jgi:hypothetical protein
MTSMTDDELLAMTGDEIRTSVGYFASRVSNMRREAMQYYLGLPVGDLAPPAIEGRSKFVATDVADTIEWMLPSLMKVFTGGDSTVEFTPQQPGAEQASKQATDYINYVFYRQNPGYQIMYTWIKDALLQKNGILKVWWDDKIEETKEEYEGLSDIELAMLMRDQELTVTAHREYPDPAAQQQREHIVQQLQQAAQQPDQQPPAPQPGQPPQPDPRQQIAQQLQAIQAQPLPMLHDVTVKREKPHRQVRIANVPPEEFLIARDAKNIQECRFCAHQVLRTRSDLKAMGYKNVEDLVSDDTTAQLSPERVERAIWNDEMAYLTASQAPPGDPSLTEIWVTECYLRADVDGDGIAEWRKVVRAGNRILDNEECDGPPFVSITPVPLPHQFFGLSIADLAKESQRLRTSVMRSMLDNLYLQANGRYYAVNGQVNLDDLLTSRPGGIVRVNSPQAVGRLDQGVADAAGSYQMLETIESIRENRTGWTRYSQGVNADSLNQTATGVNIITNRGDLRLDLIARNFAETGVRDLFLMILKLVCQNQDEQSQLYINGQWLQVDPREWKNQFDLIVNVGLGTNNKDQAVHQLMALLNLQKEGMAIGVATPQNIYNAATKLAENMGFKAPEQFWTDPSKQPQQPPGPPPEVQAEQMRSQATMQLEQLKVQSQERLAQSKAQLDAQLAKAEQEFQAAQVQHQQQLEAQRRSAETQLEMQLEQFKTQKQMELEQFKANLAQQTAIEVAKINAQAKIAASQVMAEVTDGQDELEHENVGA